MADKNDSGDKTEQPTPKKIKDARTKGDVAKSRDLSSTLVLVLWLVLYGFLLGYAADRLASLMNSTFLSPGKDFGYQLTSIGHEAFITLLVLVAIFFIPVAVFGTLIEFLQVGPVFTFEKTKLKMENLNFASGMKRMFSMDNFVEVVKNLLKTTLLFAIGYIIFITAIPQIVQLSTTSADTIASVLWSVISKLLLWTIAIFTLISVGDVLYQRYSWTRKLRMSRRDIKQELKDNEGSPEMKQKRRETHEEWAEQGAPQTASEANVLIVNPTHVAIAINHDKETNPVPVVAAKGKDFMAQRMREAAENAHVPILQNVTLARELLKECEEGDIVPEELFDIIAEVILWSNTVRDEMLAEKEGSNKTRKKYPPPGEDLTRYAETRIRDPKTLS